MVTRVDKGGALHIYHQRRQPTGGEGAGTDGMRGGGPSVGARCVGGEGWGVGGSGLGVCCWVWLLGRLAALGGCRLAWLC